ncbi:MAG: DUF167 domain-containing protein [Methanotrichaceae archaeon]|nr:DUF167 domain-containing protein [Methanotrichaceae archaeon]
MDFKEAIKTHPQGFVIRFEVVPGSSRRLVPSGFNPWKNVLEAKLTEKPHHGRANRQLMEALAELLNIPIGQIEILSGQKSARKIVLIKGIALKKAILLLKKNN